jgi:hypothetical protein
MHVPVEPITVPSMKPLQWYVVTGLIGLVVLCGAFALSRTLPQEVASPPVSEMSEWPTAPVTSSPEPETTEAPVTTSPEATPEPVPTSGAYETGVRTAEELDRLWNETKDFSRGLWSTLTNKEN